MSRQKKSTASPLGGWEKPPTKSSELRRRASNRGASSVTVAAGEHLQDLIEAQRPGGTIEVGNRRHHQNVYRGGSALEHFRQDSRVAVKRRHPSR
jgi:hypothetical protein